MSWVVAASTIEAAQDFRIVSYEIVRTCTDDRNAILLVQFLMLGGLNA